MQRRHIKQIDTLEERLATEAKQLREEARTLRPGIERERAIRKARQLDTASHINEWLESPGLQPPK